MPAAISSLSDVSIWARTSLLQIVLLITGAILLTRFANWVGGKILARIDRSSGGSDDALVRSEATKHRHAVAAVVTWATLVLIYCLTAVLVFQRLGVPLSGFVAPATVVGVALGFGAQRIVQDVLAGFFAIAERQYGFGDVIRISATGVATPVTGTVEDVTLRITRLRSLNGEVIITPNGQITQVTNLSRDWARAVVDVPVAASVDLNRVNAILRQVGDEAFADEELHAMLLDPPSVMGVETIEADQFTVRMIARTLPGKQFDVGRALRARITVAFLREGITVPAGLDTAAPTAAS
jgi:small conductance mechanosensitive channel